MSTMAPFGDRLADRIEELDAPCVVGLDPRPERLPGFARTGPDRGLSADAAAALAWNEAVIEAVAPIVPMVKPQSAFYEALGVDGFRVLRDTIRCAQEAGLLVILDSKRADIGSTADAYAHTAFSSKLLGADCVTTLHYFGTEGLEPFLRYAREEGRGVFVVVHSSNPSAGALQETALSDGGRYYELVAEAVCAWGADCIGERHGYSSVGAVMGATYPQQLREVRERFPAMPLLIPGYGHQGGTASDVRDVLTARPGGAVVAASRSIYALDEAEAERDRAQLVNLVAERARSMVAELRSTAGSASPRSPRGAA
jgi:orotidine-5'-phosphate decarboxylase